MKLAHTVRVRTDGYEPYAYIYNTANGYRSFSEGIASDILELLREYTSIDELAERIARAYHVSDTAMVRNDCIDYLCELHEHQCLEQAEGAMNHEPFYEHMSHAEASSTDISNTDDFDAELRAVCEQNRTLEHAYFELTYRCNARCIHCYEDHCPSNPHELTFDEVCHALDELRAMNTMQVTFTGGEVAMRPDFIDICQYAAQLGFVVHVYTNGTGFSRDELERLAAMGVGSVSVSLYGPTEAAHDAITQRPGSFRSAQAALRLFKGQGIRTRVKTILIKQTLPGMKDLIDLVAAEGHELELSLQVLASQTGAYDADALRVHDVNELADIIRYEQEAMNRTTPRIRPGSRTHVCGVGYSINITPTGDITPCNVLTTPLGNVREASVASIWRRSRELARLRQLSRRDLHATCRNCSLFEYCLYCPGQSWREHGIISSPCSANCELARAKALAFGAASAG